jgi:hypothetical protein
MATEKYTGPTLIGDLALDCTVTETHTATSTVTEHPVESGANITDHIRPDPVQLSITGIVSDTPIGSRQVQRSIEVGGASVQVTQQEPPSSATGFGRAAWAKLDAIRTAAKPVKVVTRDKTYDSMALVSLSVPKESKTGGALYFTAQFKQIRIVYNRTTKVVVAKATKSHKKQDTGKQPTAAVEQPKSYSSELRDQAGDAGVDKALGKIRDIRSSLGLGR